MAGFMLFYILNSSSSHNFIFKAFLLALLSIRELDQFPPPDEAGVFFSSITPIAQRPKHHY
jgi:hypothetical protein